MKTPAYISHRLLTFITHCLIAPLLIVVATGANAAHQQIDPTRAQKQQEEPKRKAAPLTDDEIQEARTLLSKLGYWLDEQAKGRDASLRHALIAFQKIEDRKRTGVLTREELEALRKAQSPLPQEEGYPHIEVDLQLQVLFVVEVDDVPLRILPISSGSGELFTEGGVTRRAITPTGRFKVVRKIEGWRKSPLGLLYYPNYIYDGIAIHGNPSVPAHPASHGCIRIPMFAAEEFSQIAVIGMEVIVYDEIIP
jgi:lipoprotein-anchoring transpeptidase ErfK/SrfK